MAVSEGGFASRGGGAILALGLVNPFPTVSSLGDNFKTP